MKNSRRTTPGSYAELRMWAEAFADAQQFRIVFENKDRSGQVPTDALAGTIDIYREAEERLRKEMTACYRATVPARLLQWQEESAGIGEATLARLLGITGDPRRGLPQHWAGEGRNRVLVPGEPFDRTVGQLWQYCGVGARKNREVKGDAAALMANGSPDAKKLVYLLAQSQVKSNAKGGAAYRHVYDQVKAKYAEKVHAYECPGGYFNALYVKCKTGKDKAYAQAGDPYQPSHVNAIALRIVGKEILRDIWRTAGGDEPVHGVWLGSDHRMSGDRRREHQH